MMHGRPLDLNAARLRPGGEFRFGTDHPVYLAHALMVMRRHRHQFEWQVQTAQDFLTRPGGWPETRYEAKARAQGHDVWRSEEHTSELQSLMRISYAVFCLKKKKNTKVKSPKSKIRMRNKNTIMIIESIVSNTTQSYNIKHTLLVQYLKRS